MTFGDLKSSTSSTSSSVPGSPSSGRSLKIVWQEEIRRLPFNAASGDLQALKELCASCFGIKNLAGLVFTYEDSEGDTVTLSTIEELRDIVESSPVTIKLNLQRKVNKAKPQQQPVLVPTKETPAAPQPIAVEVIQPEQSQQQQPQAQPEKKKNLRKERKQQLKREIVHSKVVRIRWRTAAPETSTTETPIKEKKDKGCYVNVSLKGKVKFGGCAQSQNGLWLMHELSSGEIIFAPLSAPNCCLRVFADGRINLTQGGAGPRARWNLVKAQDQTALPLNSFGATERVQFASRFVPGLNLAVIQEFNRKNKPALHPKGVNATSTATVLTSEFTIEVQDPMTSLVKFAKNVAAKKKAIKNVLKRKEEQDEEALVGEKKMNKNKLNKLNKEKAADNNGNGKVKKNNNNKNKDPNWASMTKQQRLEAKAARKLEKLEQKRLKMALKKKM